MVVACGVETEESVALSYAARGNKVALHWGSSKWRERREPVSKSWQKVMEEANGRRRRNMGGSGAACEAGECGREDGRAAPNNVDRWASMGSRLGVT